MAGLPTDFNEDDFDEYNPHPYLGGYDIARTYGEPLLPSAATCYPLSAPSSPAPPLAPPVAEPETPAPPPVAPPPVAPPPIVPPVAEPETTPPPVAVAVPEFTPVPFVPEPERHEPYEYGEPYQPEPYKPDLFRSWPFSNSEYNYKWRCGAVKDYDYWNQMMKGLDFLFGHAQGYGERRVGTDVYGIPIYANQKNYSESLVVQVEQPSVHRLDYYDYSGESENRTDEGYNYGNAYYYGNSYDQPSNAQIDSSDKFEICQDVGSDYYRDSSSYIEESGESNFFSTPIYSYNQHYYEQPLNIQVEPDEPQNFISYESSKSYYEKGVEEGCVTDAWDHNYERQYYVQNDEKSLELFQPSWSRNLGYYEAHLHGEPIRSDQDSSLFSGESDYYQQPQNTTWFNPSNCNSYTEDAPQKSNWGDDDSYYSMTEAFFSPSPRFRSTDY